MSLLCYIFLRFERLDRRSYLLLKNVIVLFLNIHVRVFVSKLFQNLYYLDC